MVGSRKILDRVDLDVAPASTRASISAADNAARSPARARAARIEPVAPTVLRSPECDTAEKWPAALQTGNADAGSVMMLYGKARTGQQTFARHRARMLRSAQAVRC